MRACGRRKGWDCSRESPPGLSLDRVLAKAHDASSSLWFQKVSKHEPRVRSLWAAWGKRWLPFLFILLFLLLLQETESQLQLATAKQTWSFTKFLLSHKAKLNNYREGRVALAVQTNEVTLGPQTLPGSSLPIFSLFSIVALTPFSLCGSVGAHRQFQPCNQRGRRTSSVDQVLTNLGEDWLV